MNSNHSDTDNQVHTGSHLEFDIRTVDNRLEQSEDTHSIRSDNQLEDNRIYF